MAQLIINLDEDVILRIVSAAAREQASVSKWVTDLVLGAEAGKGSPRPLPAPGGCRRGTYTDLIPESCHEAFLEPW
jgi:hypothetical protein